MFLEASLTPPPSELLPLPAGASHGSAGITGGRALGTPLGSSPAAVSQRQAGFRCGLHQTALEDTLDREICTCKNNIRPLNFCVVLFTLWHTGSVALLIDVRY